MESTNEITVPINSHDRPTPPVHSEAEAKIAADKNAP